MVLQSIKEIEIMSALKVGALSGALIGLIYGLFVAGFIVLMSIFGSIFGGEIGILGIIGAIVALIGTIIAGAIFMGIYFTILAILYNYIIAKFTGGLKINLE